MANKLISKLVVGSTTYDIKDAQAREDIAKIVAGGVKFIGVTTTALTDGATTNPITIIDGESTKQVTAVSGDLTIKKTDGETYTAEYIFDGTAWRELGAGSKLKALAYKDTASASYTPAGTIAAQAFSGTAATVSMDAYTPAGTIAAPTFTGTEVDLTNGSCTATGTVSAPTITVSTDAASGSIIPQANVDETNETLNLTAVTISATATAPTFTGTAATVTGQVTAAGLVAAPTFTGTEATLSGSYTPAGTVETATFTGTAATITVS